MVKHSKLKEKVITNEMDAEIKEVEATEKLKAKEIIPDEDRGFIVASFSYGMTAKDVKATLDRYALRGAIPLDIASMLYTVLTNNIVTVTNRIDLCGDLSEKNIRRQSEKIKKLIVADVVEGMTKGLYIKTDIKQ